MPRCLEVLEERTLLAVLSAVDVRKSDDLSTIAPAALTAYTPWGVTRNDVAQQLAAGGNIRSLNEYNTNQELAGNELTSLTTIPETEPPGTSGGNDSPGSAQPIVDLGTGVGEDPAVDVFGELAPPTTPTPIGPFAEDDGSILLANNTGLVGNSSVVTSGIIGDGPHGSSGSGSGDFDFFRVSDVTAGQTIVVDVDTPDPFGALDPFVAIWSSSGTLLGSNDDDAVSFDSFLSFVAPANDDYFVSVAGFGSSIPSNPFDSGSGSGFGSEGTYQVTIGLDSLDKDFYSFELKAGDILGANVDGSADHLTLRGASNQELIGSDQEISFIYPAASPLPGGGNASLSWVVDAPGTYTIAVDGGVGPYELNLRLFRPELELQPRRNHQILFLDFDGATFDTASFGLPGERTLSPLSDFLDGWGLSAADEDAVIDSIIASVEENFADIGLLGNNGDFETDGIDGHYDIEILNSRDDTDRFGLDPFGQPNVSRVIIGGTIDELGISTIAIAESIDVGNFETEESAIVLLDLLSAPSGNPNSLNQFPLGGGASIIDLIGVGVGNIASHESGHFFANWHTFQFNGLANIMDQGGFLANTVGVGPNGIFEGGAGDDTDVDFGKDLFVPAEGFTGTEDTLNSIAFGLSTGTLDQGMVVISSSPADGEFVSSPPSDFIVDFLDPYDLATVNASDFMVNSIAADSVSPTDADTLIFHFATSPVLAEGPQTMEMGAGVIARESDNDPLAPFSANFYYDAVLLEIVSIEPAAGSVAELPLGTVRVHFSEPVSPGSIGSDDLIVSQGAVVGFHQVDADTIDYTIEGLLEEGTLTLQFPIASLTDLFGNPSAAFSDSFELDFGKVPYPVPLEAKEPLGSLIYDPIMGGTIDPGDIDTFTLLVDPGQTISVVVTPTGTLQPKVELYTQKKRRDSLLGSATSAAPGEDVVLQATALKGLISRSRPRARSYRIDVSGAEGTSGQYQVQIILNAAIEEESRDGPANNTLATAQDIESSFIPLSNRFDRSYHYQHGPKRQPDRGAVLGSLGLASMFSADFETGDDGLRILAPESGDNYSFSLEAGESLTLALTKQSVGNLGLTLLDSEGNVLGESLGQADLIVNGSFETGDFTGWTAAQTGSPFQPWQVTGAGFGDGFGISPTQPQDGSFVAWNGFDGAGPMEFTMFQDVSIPADVPTATLQWQDRAQWVFFTSGAAARTFEIQVRDPATNFLLDTVYSFSSESEVVNPTGDTSWQTHSADLSAFKGSTVRLFFEEVIPEFFTGPAQFELDEIKLLTGLALATNVDQLISNFVAPETGTYFVQVSGSGNTDYSLVATRNADFEREDNNDIDSAQEILSTRAAGRQWILGHVNGPSGTLYGSSRGGDLFTLDTTTGAGSLVGFLPVPTTEIEYSNDTGRAFAQLPNGGFAGQEFDIETGAGIGSVIFNGASFNGLEYVGSTLYGTAIAGPGGPSELRTLDPFSGTSASIGLTGVGPVSGLAYDEATGVMYAVAGGPGPADLYTIDLVTGAAAVVGSTGFQAGSLQFGDDGALYGGGTGSDSGGLFQIEPSTGASTLLGATGFSTVTGLTFREEAADSDFYSVTLKDHEPLIVKTFTPAAGPGEFVNLLDPIIRLYDADGNLIASDDNSSADGRNARLKYRVPKDGAGSYFIEVAGSGETSGEYILTIKHPKVSLAPGDANGDFLVNLGDVAPLIQSLVDRAAYDRAYPGVSIDVTGDMDGSGTFDLGDISAFGKLFNSGLASASSASTFAAPVASVPTLAADVEVNSEPFVTSLLSLGNESPSRLDLLAGSVLDDTSPHDFEAIWDEALLDVLEDTLR